MRKIGDEPRFIVATAAAVPSIFVAGVAAVLMLSGFAPSAALPAGITGPPGPVSAAIGPQGETITPDLSDEGTTGPVGLLGSLGLIGPAGPAGPAGQDGAPGAQGTAGVSGPAGPQGLQGIQGFDGATGPMGLVGPQGETGAMGATGPQGETGATGPQGETGAEGPTGSPGPQGPPGETGPAGPAGADGATGPEGPMGPAGPAGPAGVSAGYDPDWRGVGLNVPNNADSGSYIRNGNLVHFRIFLTFAGVTDFGTGNYTVSLPFPPSQSYIFHDGAIFDHSTGNQYPILGDAASATATLNLVFLSGNKTLPVDHNSPHALNTTGTVYLSGTYEVAP